MRIDGIALDRTVDELVSEWRREAARRPSHAGAALDAYRRAAIRLRKAVWDALSSGLVDVLGWPLVFLLLGLLFVACVGLVFWCDEPEHPPVPRAWLACAC